jgi:hypothetical protein
MAKTSFIVLTDEQRILFEKNLQSGDRFTFGKVCRKKVFFSRKAVKGLTARSLLPQIAEAWNSLTPTEKDDWKTAGAVCAMRAYNAFVKDKSARIKNDIAGNATPSILHQNWCGYLTTEAPATEIKLTQLHPHTYWVSQKVAGKKGMYEPVQVIEDLALPLKISMSYKSDLISQGAGSFARLFARVRHSYQGVDRYTDLICELSLSTGWVSIDNTLSTVIGQLISYNLYLHLYNVRGTLLCDNIKAEHSGQNWVRDTYCNDIDQSFTRAFYQIPKHWVALTLPDGADFGTIYPED